LQSDTIIAMSAEIQDQLMRIPKHVGDASPADLVLVYVAMRQLRESLMTMEHNVMDVADTEVQPL
jgi:hypothetical protein